MKRWMEKQHLVLWRGPCSQGRIKLYGAPRQWKHFRPLFQAGSVSFGGVGIATTPPPESNTTSPSPKTEI